MILDSAAGFLYVLLPYLVVIPLGAVLLYFVIRLAVVHALRAHVRWIKDQQ